MIAHLMLIYCGKCNNEIWKFELGERRSHFLFNVCWSKCRHLLGIFSLLAESNDDSLDPVSRAFISDMKVKLPTSFGVITSCCWWTVACQLISYVRLATTRLSFLVYCCLIRYLISLLAVLCKNCSFFFQFFTQQNAQQQSLCLTNIHERWKKILADSFFSFWKMIWI